MVKKKQSYESPQIIETHVELESSICNGSVEFKENPKVEEDKGVTISTQSIANTEGSTVNDFSSSTAWSMDTTNPTE